MICPVAGGGRPARRQTGVSQRGQAGFQRSRPPDTPHLTIGTTPPGARASRPHAVPSVAAQFPCDVAANRPAGGNRMGPAEAEAGRRCRLIPVEEMAEAAGGFVRAGRPRSHWASSHDRVTPTGQKCRSILAPVVVEGGSSVFVSIRVHWWFVFNCDQLSCSHDPRGRAGASLRARRCCGGGEPFRVTTAQAPQYVPVNDGSGATLQPGTESSSGCGSSSTPTSPGVRRFKRGRFPCLSR